jgi:ABC-type uncharacterized transport system substrate-binding protein
MERVRADAADIINLKPDAILVGGRRTLSVLQKSTQSIPVVFAGITDPVEQGIVPSLTRPGGNITGFSTLEPSMVGKMLELLKQIAPNITRAAFIFSPDNLSAALLSNPFEALTPPLALQASLLPVRGPADITRAIDGFAQEPNGGLLFASDVTVYTHRELIITRVAYHRLPAIYDNAALGLPGLTSAPITAKQLQLLQGLSPGSGASDSAMAQAAATSLRLKIHVVHASAGSDLDAAFDDFRRAQTTAVLVFPDPLFIDVRGPVIELAARHKLPVLYPDRTLVEAGGLMAYGSSRTAAYREAGNYVGRILRGEEPAELPVIQSSKFELVINLKTAKALGLDVPPTLLALADEVIEAPQVHHAAWRRSGLADSGSRAAAGDAGDWISRRPVL